MRKHLGFTIDEWEALPWWQQQVYREGVEDDAARQERGSRRAGRGHGGQVAPPAQQQQSQTADMESRFNVTHVKFGG